MVNSETSKELSVAEARAQGGIRELRRACLQPKNAGTYHAVMESMERFEEGAQQDRTCALDKPFFLQGDDVPASERRGLQQGSCCTPPSERQGTGLKLGGPEVPGRDMRQTLQRHCETQL